MAFDLTVHHMEKDEGTGRYRVVRVTPYRRFDASGMPVIYEREGICYDPGGSIIPWDKLPARIKERIAKYSMKGARDGDDNSDS